MVEFLGGPLENLAFGARPELAVETSRGKIADNRMVEPVPDGAPGHWSAQFDLGGVEGPEPVDLRAVLREGDRILSESWIFRYHPFAT